VKTVIITALKQETEAVLSCFESREKKSIGRHPLYSCRSGGVTALVIESGMGGKNGESAAESIIEADRPELLVSAGFCGGIDPSLAVGDIVVAQEIIAFQEGAMERADFISFAVPLDFPGKRGIFITGDRIMEKKMVARVIDEAFRHPVLEMESAYLARVAARENIPFLGVRSVSDPWNEELLFRIEEFCDDSMKISPARVLRSIIRKPLILPQLIRLASGGGKASRSLSSAILALFPLLAGNRF